MILSNCTGEWLSPSMITGESAGT